MPKKYKLLADRFEHKAGATVYHCLQHDYGCARDDRLVTGEDHISVTLDSNGGYPFFTVPVDSLQFIEE